MKPRRPITYALFAAGLGLVALAAAMPRRGTAPPPAPPLAAPDPPPQVAQPQVAQPQPQAPAQPEQPVVEVVFALDTTGSMEGLIEGAKRKIWSIVSFIASGQPQPRVRIGLIGYRDLGDDYVTRFYDLSEDMDEVFEHLQRFRADGGGDTPEHVARALHDAVNRTHWTQGDKVAKIVYLVGDAPPHTDYDDGYNYRAIVRRAAEKGIRINAILCGDDSEAAQAFRAVARLGVGQYASIAQSGGVRAVVTPYDKKLADLNTHLASTVVGYGSGGGALKSRVTASTAAPAAVAADRAAFAARTGKAAFADGDLIDAAGTRGLANIPKAELPAELQAMPAAAQEQFVAEKQAERAKVMAEIKELSAEREAFMKKADAAEGKMGRRRAAPRAFDDEVRSTLIEQTRGVVTY